MKRNLVIIIVILLLALTAGYFYFSREEVSFEKDTSLYEAIPVSSPFFFEFQSVRSFPFENLFINELIRSGTGKSFFSSLQKIDTLINNSEEIPKSLGNSPFILSFGFAGRNQLIPLIIKEAKNSGRKKMLENLIHLYYPEEYHKYSEKEYGDSRIIEISRDNGQTTVFYSFIHGILLISTKSLSLEQAIRQLETPGIINNPYFREVNKTANAGEVSLYINHANFPQFLDSFLNGQPEERVDEFGETVKYSSREKASKFKDFAAWSELDFRFSDDHLVLSGISAADDSLNHFLSVFNGQQPVNSGADEILPRETSFFCSFSFNDKEKFFMHLEEYFKHSGSYYKREERIKRFESGFKDDVRKIFTGMARDEIIVSVNIIPVNPENKTAFFIIHTEGKTAAEEQLQKLLAAYAAGAGTELSEMRSEYKVDEEISYNIYSFPYPSFPGIWLGIPFSMAEARYVAFYDNFMVFSNSKAGLTGYLRSMVLDATLAKDLRYMRFRQNSSGRSNFNVYIDINKTFGLSKDIFDNNFIRKAIKQEETIRKYNAVNWQVQHDKGIYFNAVSVSYNPDPGEEAQTTWQSTIGSDIGLKPALAVNHDDRENMDIILQDKNNTLHQLTDKGRVRWSISLPGPILSGIHQVDYYKNGKLQYLFNTKEKLFLIDRNGNNVAHFPVSLRSPATNGVNVFDYNNNRDYRYFVAGEDKKIYAYDSSGKIVDGWVFGQTDHQVVTPVQHFRVAGRDYIVFKDKSRIYIQNRRGETRVPTKARFENSENPLALNLDGRPKIVADDNTGKVYYLYFNGEYEEKKTAKFSGDHYFAVDDIDGNKVPDFIFVDGDELTVIDEKGKKQFSEKFDNPIIYPPNIYTFAYNLKKVGIVDAKANRIYLFNPDGKIHKDFPLQGNSEFSIGKLSDNSGSLNLLVGSEGGKLYNYTIE